MVEDKYCRFYPKVYCLYSEYCTQNNYQFQDAGCLVCKSQSLQAKIKKLDEQLRA